MGMEEWSQVELWKQVLFNPIIRIRVRPKGSLFQTGGDALCQKKGKKSCVYKAECKAVSKLMDELKSTLDGDQYTRIEELHRHMSTTQCMESREQFRYGLSMGLLMMKEAYEHPCSQRED